MSSANKVELDDYEDAMEKLLTELREYEAATTTLRQAAQSLDRIHTFNSNAGKSLNALAADASQILGAIESLNLDHLVTQSNERYSSHQSSLEQLGRAIQDAVHEQQRLGLEMLQHTTASQKELAFYSHRVEQTSQDSRQWQESFDAYLHAFASTTETRFQRLHTQVGMLRNLLFVSLVLLVIVGIIAFLR